MKKLFLFFFFCSLFLLSGCSGDDDNTQENTSISVEVLGSEDNTKIVFSIQEESKVFRVVAEKNVEWSITTDEKGWYSLDKTEGAGTAVVQITVAENEIDRGNVGWVSVKAKGAADSEVVKVILVQELQANPDAIHVEEAGTLKKLLTEQNLVGVRSLNVTGELNYADLDSLRYFESLTKLDLSLVTIVEGKRLDKSTGEWVISPGNTIDQYAFAYNYYIKEIALPRKITSLKEFSFTYCLDLKSVAMFMDVDSIYSNAFEGCSKLQYVVVPSYLNYVGDAAFKNCYSLKNFLINSNLGHIGNEAFSGCSSLVIPVVEIGSNLIIRSEAFKGCASIKTLTFTGGSVSIGLEAFAYSGLSQLTFSNQGASISDFAFQGCPLSQITLSYFPSIASKSVFGEGRCTLYIPMSLDIPKGSVWEDLAKTYFMVVRF